MTVTLQAYQFALDPVPEQEAMLRSHCGAQRYAFNWGLARIKANLGQREAEKSYGITGSDLTPPLSWSAWSLRKDWNQVKGDVAPWWAQNSKEAYAAGLANLSAGLRNWKDSRSGKRKGPAVRFPRFKGKRAGVSCRFSTGAFGLAGPGRRHVRLPRGERVLPLRQELPLELIARASSAACPAASHLGPKRHEAAQSARRDES